MKENKTGLFLKGCSVLIEGCLTPHQPDVAAAGAGGRVSVYPEEAEVRQEVVSRSPGGC